MFQMSYDTGYFLGKTIQREGSDYYKIKKVIEQRTESAVLEGSPTKKPFLSILYSNLSFNCSVYEVTSKSSMVMQASTTTVHQLPKVVNALQRLQKSAGGKDKLLGRGIPYVDSYIYCDGHYALTMYKPSNTLEWTISDDKNPFKNAIEKSNAKVFHDLVRIELNLKSFQKNRINCFS